MSGRFSRGFALGVAAALVAGLPSVLSSQLAAADVVAPAPPALALTAAIPSVSGSVAVGSTLTAQPGTWTAGTVFTYQWLAAGAAIPGAKAASFVVTTAQVGKALSVTVTGALAGEAVSKTSAATAKVMLAGTPKVSGKPKLGSSVKASRGSWTSAVKFSYRWLRDGKPISGATKVSYKLGKSDAGKQLSVRVTGKRSGYASVTKTSAAVGVGLQPLKTAVPTISGKTTWVGNTLTVAAGKWTPGTKLAYQWLANGTSIAGATGKTYRTTWREGGKSIRVTVTGSKSGYQTASRTSSATKTLPQVPNYIDDDTYRYQVGVDVQPGTYAAAGGANCVWARLKSYPWVQGQELASGPLHNGRALVTLNAGEIFITDDCGDWRTPTGSVPPTQLGDGDYLIGTQLMPGTYESAGGLTCVWWRLNEAGLDFEKSAPGSNGVLGVNYHHNGFMIVTIKPTDKVFTSVGCGNWRPLAQRASWSDTVGEGDWAVGNHLAAGTYRATSVTDKCQVELASGFAHDGVEVTGLVSAIAGSTELTVVIPAGTVRFSTWDCGTWTLQPAAKPAAAAVQPVGLARSVPAVGQVTKRLAALGTHAPKLSR